MPDGPPAKGKGDGGHETDDAYEEDDQDDSEAAPSPPSPAYQVRRERSNAGVKVARMDCPFDASNVATCDSNRRHRQGGRLRSIRGFTQIEETGGRE